MRWRRRDGGVVDGVCADAWFLYSGDGGHTWTQSPVLNGYYSLGLSFIDPTHAFAVMDNTATGASALAEYK